MNTTVKDRVKKYAEGGFIDEVVDPTDGGKKRLTSKQIKIKYKNNPYVTDRAEWADTLDKHFKIIKDNEVVDDTKSPTVKQSVYKAAKSTKINPALLYTSAMEEGLNTAIYQPDNARSTSYDVMKDNLDIAKKVNKSDIGGADWEKKYPIDGFNAYGLDTFGDNAKDLIKKGYLPKDFGDKNYSVFEGINEKGKKVPTAAFASHQDALTAKAAMIRQSQDQLDTYNKKKGYKLSDQGRDFFTLANYNGGEGTMQKMLDLYNTKGYLKNDAYLNPTFKPGKGEYGEPYKNVQKRIQNKKVLEDEGYFKDFATGGVASDGLGGYSGLIQQIPAIADGIINLLEHNPNAYSDQPIVNASTMRGMVTPYKNMAHGGWIKKAVNPAHKGYCTPMTKATCTPKRKALAMTFKKHHGFHKAAYGDDGVGMDQLGEDQMMELQSMADEQGVTVEEMIQMLQDQQDGTEEDQSTDDNTEYANGGQLMKYSVGGQIPIEVEGGEVVQTPDGTTSKVHGKSHENGGVNVAVPDGTKIYSDRLTVDGKTMQERKLRRERSLSKLDKLLKNNPTDPILKNTVARTMETTKAEESQDMQLQQAASQILPEPKRKMGMGGKVKYAAGGYTGDPLLDTPVSLIDYNPDFNIGIDTRTSPNTNTTPYNRAMKTPVTPYTGQMGVGDYIGMAGNAFNAIAPMINTINNAKANKPNINRFKSFGKDALKANQTAQEYVAGVKTNANTDIDTSVNSAYARNRNSASGVNTVRALDIATDMTKNKAKNATNDAFAKQMMGLLGQESQLSNVRDKVVMTGEQQRDIENKADQDNFYSNMAQNLTNLGTNVQGIGKSLNVSKGNKLDSNMVSQLSQYGLAFDENGNLISLSR